MAKQAPRNAPRRRFEGACRAPRTERHDGPWLYGRHAVLAALANPRRRCRRLLATAEAQREGLPPSPGIATETVTRHELDRLLPDAVHQGLALLAEPLPEPGLEDALKEAPGRPVLVLDQVSDPRNVGAILRSAAAFGAACVIVQERHAPQATGALAKAASGALEIVPLLRETNIARTLDALKSQGYWCIGLDAAVPTTLARAKPEESRPVALVLGAEGMGLRRLVAERCDALARLPITKAVESLNVSNAAAVALYEIAVKNEA